MLITDLAVFAKTGGAGAPFTLIETAPGVSVDEVKAKTAARFVVDQSVGTSA